MQSDIDRVLDFWFGPDEPPSEPFRKRWFSGGAELDREIESEFGDLHELVRGGLPSDWQDARGKLAAIILIDQFSRNIFRGNARAFEWDALAQDWASEGWTNGLFHSLSPAYQAFAIMPLVHSESLELHDLASKYFDHAIAQAKGADTMLTGFLSSAKEHRAIIQAFGRYPHRNAVLGRTPTAAEEAYLNDGAKRFGQ